MATESTVPGKKNLKITAEISKSIKSHYVGVQEAKKEGKPVVWAFGIIPREIFHAMDVPAIYLEHFPIMLSAKQLSGRYCEMAEEVGFARDLCAFHTCCIGCAASEDRDSYAERLFTPPDLIIASNFPCMSESKSFLYMADRFNCPYFFLDVPINTWGKDLPDYAVNYYVDQLEGLFSFLEKHGYKLDMEKLSRAIGLSRRLHFLWEEIEGYRKTVPAPIGFTDGFNCVYPLVNLAGTRLGVELYEGPRDELKERIANKERVVAEEKLRLYWAGVPPVYNLGLLNYPEQYGAIIVKGSVEFLLGGAVEPEILDPDKPLESLARKSIVEVVNPPYKSLVDFIVKDVKDYKIDGVIEVVKRGCRLLPGSLRLTKDAVYEQANVPSTIFDLDGLDLREYDDARAKANIDSFIETLLASKGMR